MQTHPQLRYNHALTHSTAGQGMQMIRQKNGWELDVRAKAHTPALHACLHVLATQRSRLQTLQCKSQCRCLPINCKQCPSSAGAEAGRARLAAPTTSLPMSHTQPYTCICGILLYYSRPEGLGWHFAAILRTTRSTNILKNCGQKRLCSSCSVARAVAEEADSMQCHAVGQHRVGCCMLLGDVQYVLRPARVAAS
jgi:hypothetical protein